MAALLPVPLHHECRRAAKIFHSFSTIIPGEILRDARGFAIITVTKGGFLLSARAGSGVVIAKLPGGSWSAPSAIGLGSCGLGFQLGVEVTELVILINSKAALQQFYTAGSLSFGGAFSIAVGPIGREVEAGAGLSSSGAAAIYSYSRSKGLFGGISVEGSVIVERSDANAKAYTADVSAKQLLTGQVERPPFADILISQIERRTGSLSDSKWVDDSAGRPRGYTFSASTSGADSPVEDERKRRKSLGTMFDSKPKDSPTKEKEGFFARKLRRNTSKGVIWQDEETLTPPRSLNPSRRGSSQYTPTQLKPRLDEANPFETAEDFTSFSSRSRSPSPNFSLDNEDRSEPFTPASSLNTDRVAYSYSDGEGDAKNELFSSTASSKPKPTKRPSKLKFPSFRSKPKTPPALVDSTENRPRDSLDSFNSLYDQSPTRAQVSTQPAHKDRILEDFDRALALSPTPSTDSHFKVDTLDGVDNHGFDFRGEVFQQETMHYARPTVPVTDTRRTSMNNRVTAIFDFDGEEDGDLKFKRGDTVEILEKSDSEWWIGRVGFKEGMFPVNRTDARR